MMEPKVSAFDSKALEYDSWFEDEGKPIFATEVQAFQQILPLLSKPWLEIGVGSGRFAQTLGISIGLDPSIELLKIAKSRGINVFLGRGELAPFRDGTFGTVFLILTLCFVDSPLAVFKEVDRNLKDSGKIALGLVLRESPWGKFYQHKKKLGHHFYKHVLQLRGTRSTPSTSWLFNRDRYLNAVSKARKCEKYGISTTGLLS
jgi:SAM-dependent methyltransferase